MIPPQRMALNTYTHSWNMTHCSVSDHGQVPARIAGQRHAFVEEVTIEVYVAVTNEALEEVATHSPMLPSNFFSMSSATRVIVT